MIKICQCCGAILKNELGSCEACGAELAFNAPTSIPSLKETMVPERIEAEKDPFLVEQVLVNRIFAMVNESSSTGDQVNREDPNSSSSGKRLSNSISISVSKPNEIEKTNTVDPVDPHSFFDSMNSAIEDITPLTPTRDQKVGKPTYPTERAPFVVSNDLYGTDTVIDDTDEPVGQAVDSKLVSRTKVPKKTIDKNEDDIVLHIPRKYLWVVASTLMVGLIAGIYFNSQQPHGKSNPHTNQGELRVEEPKANPNKNKSVLFRRGELLNKKESNNKLLVLSENLLNGDWEIGYSSKSVADKVTVIQTEEKFSGHGQAFYANSVIYDFDITDGVLSEKGAINFTKRYRPESIKRGAPSEPILFDGKVKKSGDSVEIAGHFTMKSTVGYFNNRKTIYKTGSFTAKLLKSYIPKPGFSIPIDINFDDIPQDKIYLLIALGIVGFCVILVVISLKLFSPSGLLNRWEKEKYVPSQYKSQHKEKLRLFSKRLRAGSLPLGRRAEWHWYWPFTPKTLALPVEERSLNPNVLLLGSSKKGKTRLMASMVSQDIASNDRAVVIIDPDGSLSDLTIQSLASSPKMVPHTDRVIIIDPTEESADIHSFNPLEYPEDGNLQSSANAIVHGFKAMYTEPPGIQSQWNEQTANILRNAALLLMLNGRTLVDLPNLLQDNDFRDLMLEKIEQHKEQKTEYIVISDTWQQYKKLARTEQWITWVEPILNRIGPTLGDSRVRRIIHKPISSLNLKNVIEEKKILIVRTPRGELDKSCNLIGSLLVTGLQKAALSLYKKQPTNQKPVAIYLEELDSFIEKDTLEKITNQSQRHQIGCVGSLKTIQHLPEDFKSCLTVNMGLIAAFSLPQKDAEILGKQIFRVDGRKTKFKTFTNFINPINTSPQFELIMDEEKLNMDRLAGQSDRTYFCYRTGTEAGVFKLHAPPFEDIPRDKLDQELLSKMWSCTSSE